MHVITDAWFPLELSGNNCGSWSFVAGLFVSIWWKTGEKHIHRLRSTPVWIDQYLRDATEPDHCTMQHNIMRSFWYRWFRPYIHGRPAAPDCRWSNGPSRKTMRDYSWRMQNDMDPRRWQPVQCPFPPSTPAFSLFPLRNCKWSLRPDCSGRQCAGMMPHTMWPIWWQTHTPSPAALKWQSIDRPHSSPFPLRLIDRASLEYSRSPADCPLRGFLFCGHVELIKEK